MNHQVESFTTTDGLEIFCQCWLPDSPRAVVIIAHGFAEHSGRYQHVVDALVTNGCAVYALDHRHHGQSDGERGYVQRISALVDDLDQYIEQVRSQHPGMPTVLLGHSMGGLVAVHYAIAHQQKIDLLALSAPYLIDGGNAPPILVKLAGVLSSLMPRLPIKPLDSAAISRDPAVVQAYESDSLIYRGKVRARTGYALLSAASAALEQANRISMPMLIMHGTADSLADVEGSRQLNESIRSEDKSLRIYNDLYHEIFHEPEKEQVIGDLVNWIQQRILA